MQFLCCSLLLNPIHRRCNARPFAGWLCNSNALQPTHHKAFPLRRPDPRLIALASLRTPRQCNAYAALSGAHLCLTVHCQCKSTPLPSLSAQITALLIIAVPLRIGPMLHHSFAVFFTPLLFSAIPPQINAPLLLAMPLPYAISSQVNRPLPLLRH